MPARDRRTVALDLVQRIIVAMALAIFVWRAYQSYAASPRLSLLLLLCSETLTVILVLVARPPERSDTRALSYALTAVGTFYFLFVRLTPAQPLVPHPAGVALQLVGLGFQISGKLWLGRRFGLLPANRGVVTTGPYRVVRHPIYAGYFLNHLGFLLGSFSLRNAAIYAFLYAVQIGRILQEERLLGADSGYSAYAAQVRYRLLPFVF